VIPDSAGRKSPATSQAILFDRAACHAALKSRAAWCAADINVL
jgi:hypothetical protein